MSFIFVSHSSRDDAAASTLRDWLQKEGHAAVFLDHDAEAGIAGGEPWEERLYTELRRCRALIALVGPDWLASPWCVAEADHAQALRKPVLPVRIQPIDPVQYADKAPPVLRRVQSIDWNQSEEAQERLRRALVTAGLDPRNSFILGNDRPPYPGLATFQRDDAAIYFGREQEVTDLLAALRECRAPSRPRLVLVQGASGTGKSSLLRAGVLPRLERDPENWLVVPPFRPLRDPFQGLTDALAVATGAAKSALSPPTTNLTDPANQAALAKWIIEVASELRRRAGRPEATVLLSVDQLEEALVGSDGTIGDGFLLALREALTAADHRLLVVATLRADFTGTLQRHSALREPAAVSGEILATRAFQLGPLPRAAFHSVIEGPATLAGLELEPGLASRIVDEARTDDALPLLAFALRELWDRYGKEDLKLTGSEYDSFGGLEAAVGRRAEQIRATVSPSAEEVEAFRTTLVFGMAELSAEGRILRRRVPWAKVPEAARRLVEEFARARLLVVDEAAVEVAHEALFRRWEPLKGWIEAAKEDLGIQRRAREAAEEWDRTGRPRGSLWRPPDLDLLRRYAARNGGIFDTVQTAFLNASERQERLVWWRTRVAVGLICLLAIGAGVFGWESRRQAQRAELERVRANERTREALEQRNQALITQSRFLARLSKERTEDGDATAGVLLALNALPRDRTDTRVLVSAAAAALMQATSNLRERAVLLHEGLVSLVALSPNGRILATITDDGVARIWDVTSGQQRALFRHGALVSAVDLSPDGRTLATTLFDKTARLWDVATGQQRVLAHQGVTRAVAFSPDGGRLLATSDERIARIWDVASGQERTVLRGHVDTVRAIAFSRDRQWIATAADDRTARIWDVASGEERAVFRHQDSVRAIAFSPDGLTLATASDGIARIWNLATGQERALAHRALIKAIAFSSDGSTLATATLDNTARVWDCASGQELTVRKQPNTVRAVALSSDGLTLATVPFDRTARVWDVANGQERVLVHHALVRDLAFAPDGRTIATASFDNTVRIWDIRTGHQHAEPLKHEDLVSAVVLSPDGRTVAIAPFDRTARIIDIATKQERVLPHQERVKSVTFSPDGRLLATASLDNRIRVWEVTSGHDHGVLMHQAPVTTMAFSHNAGALASASDDNTIRVWDVLTKKQRSRLEVQGTINALAISPDGHTLASTSGDNIARIWDVATDQEYAALTHRHALLLLAFSPDGRTLASASDDNMVRIWDLPTKQERFRLRHDGTVTNLSFSPDGRMLASASDDKTARIWDVTTGQESAVLAHQGSVSIVAFSPDGRTIASASGDKTTRLVEIPPTEIWELIDYARRKLPVGRTELSLSERENIGQSASGQHWGTDP